MEYKTEQCNLVIVPCLQKILVTTDNVLILVSEINLMKMFSAYKYWMSDLSILEGISTMFTEEKNLVLESAGVV